MTSGENFAFSYRSNVTGTLYSTTPIQMRIRSTDAEIESYVIYGI